MVFYFLVALNFLTHQHVRVFNMTRLLLLIFVLNSATHGFEKEINSQCSSSFTGDDGICMEGKDCPTFKIHRNVLNICSFNGRIPIVCCPKQFINRDDRGRQISARSEFRKRLCRIENLKFLHFTQNVRNIFQKNLIPHL